MLKAQKKFKDKPDIKLSYKFLGNEQISVSQS